jgi:hypothetical protein
LDGAEKFRAYARHTVEASEAAKWTVLGAPGNNALRERRSNTRETCDFAHVGAIQVDAFAGQEWTGELGGATRRLLQCAWPRGGVGLESNISGRIAWRGRQNEPYSCAGESQARQ